MTQEVLPLLTALRERLDAAGLWQQSPIDPEALSSQQPFCVDTLNFPQWLQFLLIPRLTALIEGGMNLPNGSNVSAMAEMYFKDAPDGGPIIQIIHDIDVALGIVE
jgi:uncharacterized protein YqcC (DUF446 family)